MNIVEIEEIIKALSIDEYTMDDVEYAYVYSEPYMGLRGRESILVVTAKGTTVTTELSRDAYPDEIKGCIVMKDGTWYKREECEYDSNWVHGSTPTLETVFKDMI